VKRSEQHRFHIPFIASVRTRLTLWYLVVVAGIICLFGGSLYATETFLNQGTSDSHLEAQLYQETQRLESVYKQAILTNQLPASQHFTLNSQEIVLLLRPDGSVMDTRGTLTGSTIQQLQSKAENISPTVDIVVPQSTSSTWDGNDTTYRVLITPILTRNARIAILMVGLVRQPTIHLFIIWLFHGTAALIVAAIGGYWLAGKALRPVKTITRTVNEISATDLRRRLNFQRKDEFGELAATFDQMLARLEAAFKRQTQFTADASHELRTPLTIIDLEINRALTQLERPEEYRQVLEQIQAENEQMTTIVNSLLFLARADTGQMTLHREKVDLSDIALASVERLLPMARKSQVTLATGDLPELLISGDPHYLGQMLTNLIENGIKYTSGVGRRVYVELACEKSCWGVVRVQDDGPGISSEHVPYLFERFYRVDKARSRRQKEPAQMADPDSLKPGGTGLGLAIVQWIVQAHEGEIRVQSEIGNGSLFEVRLPLLSDPAKLAEATMTD
jgi:signal transduction histidine kinase